MVSCQQVGQLAWCMPILPAIIGQGSCFRGINDQWIDVGLPRCGELCRVSRRKTFPAISKVPKAPLPAALMFLSLSGKCLNGIFAGAAQH